ncbi:hypothetical protein TrVFT333_006105 [Trichoderma virens FT-333]|nr:hypothetical protein TrVFT333_006105 [Trichoderma virens FT-333]
MDLATGKCHETPIGQDSSIDAIAFSPDSKMIALASNSSIRLWDAQLITLEQRLEEARVGDSTEDARVGDSIEKMAFSPDGKILASTYSNSDTIQLWDVATGTRWQAFQSPSHWPTAIVFSPNGGTLALGGHDIWLWDIATGWHTCQHEGLAGAQAADAQALDAQLVDAQLVDAQTRLLPALQSRKRLMMDNKCKAIAFSPDGRKLAYFLEEYEIQLQDIATGDIQMRFEDNEAHPTAITFSPDGKELSAVYIQKYPHATVVRVWDVATGACLRSFNSGLKKKSVKCPSIRFLPGGQLLCINNRCIKSWLQPEAEPPEHDLLLVVGDWIMRGGKHVLWLPREYRTGMMAVHDNVVAIGHKSDVIFISFNF